MVRFYTPRTPATFGHHQALDAIVKDGLTDVYGDFPMGNWCASWQGPHHLDHTEADSPSRRQRRGDRSEAADHA